MPDGYAGDCEKASCTLVQGGVGLYWEKWSYPNYRYSHAFLGREAAPNIAPAMSPH
jgi:hypothetical protein